MIEPTVQKMELSTGQTVDLCITMKGVKAIASVDKDLYKQVCNIAITGTADIVSDMALIYAAYLIANKPRGVAMRQAIKDGALLKQDEFEELLPDSMATIVKTASALVDPPRQAASAAPSNGEHELKAEA